MDRHIFKNTRIFKSESVPSDSFQPESNIIDNCPYELEAWKEAADQMAESEFPAFQIVGEMVFAILRDRESSSSESEDSE